jgi:hypothetical protein
MLGLLKDNREWFDCLEEFALVCRPRELRHLFARMLANCNIADPLRFWSCFANDLSEDMLYWGPEA